MDIALIRTFLEIASSGSFVAASERLFVTQSAVSLRVSRLEGELGKVLFSRSKAGAELTPAGRAFEPYALSLMRVWHEARRQVAVPAQFAGSLAIGAEYALWPRLGFRWIDALGAARPDLSVKAELGKPAHLIRLLSEGLIQVALSYEPQMRNGLRAERIIADELVMVSAEPLCLDEVTPHYVFVDWGHDFTHDHEIQLPQLSNGGLTLALETLAGGFIERRGKAGYLPARSAAPRIARGGLHLVPDAPRFSFPAWAIWRDDLDKELEAVARKTLCEAVESAVSAHEEVLGKDSGDNGLDD
ncbi:LysR family transcriptional regulator [Profundibacterium mesophilum]|uniref:Two-component system chemotaxis family sensor kinase CheA n=1 Tax=Profundibacterium mesophilum KAUST100406-0324 TaxID=1037889 RepID=A0A921NQ13_9RHOB|nr:LysR family transcriptional regulator [Profundibacterium mesophilum]KAF0674942.1 two-component system chemotaxis family sensor kinase CheA [Profundibacterium mesophilum KAUST100406-0324]